MAIKGSWERSSNRFAVEVFGVFHYCLARRSWCGSGKPVNKDNTLSEELEKTLVSKILKSSKYLVIWKSSRTVRKVAFSSAQSSATQHSFRVNKKLS
jgi:hypothetical protein